MTLEELARKMKELNKYISYVTVCYSLSCDCYLVEGWEYEPSLIDSYVGGPDGGYECIYWSREGEPIPSVSVLAYEGDLDLSEYTDVEGTIHYSKCIVEV